MEGTKEIKKLNKGTNEADYKNTWWMLIMYHKHDKHDKSKVTAIWFLLSSSCNGEFFSRRIWWMKGKIVDLQSHSCNSK